MSDTARPKAGGDKLSADEVNFDLPVVGTGGETLTGDTKPVAVYVGVADGELYATDAGDSNKVEFVGFVVDNTTDGNPATLQKDGVVSGFTGLTDGDKLFLAKAGTSEQDIVGSNTGTASNWNIGGSSAEEYARGFTLTDVGLFRSMTLQIFKIGTPASNINCQLRTGTPSGSGDSGSLIEEVTVNESTFSDGDNVLFTFTERKLEAGTYHLKFYRDTPSGTDYLKVKSSTTSATSYGISGGTWAGSKADAPYTIDFEGSTFSAGDLTTYYYDFAKEVAQAISDTQIRINDVKSLSRWGTVTLSSGGAKGIADKDGFLVYLGVQNTSGDIIIQTPIGTTRQWTEGTTGPQTAASVTCPVRKGDSWSVSGPSGSSCWFIPMN